MWGFGRWLLGGVIRLALRFGLHGIGWLFCLVSIHFVQLHVTPFVLKWCKGESCLCFVNITFHSARVRISARCDFLITSGKRFVYA